MFRSHRRGALLVSAMAVALVACGRSDKPPSEAKSGKAANAAPHEFWIEPPASSGEVREYYKGQLRRIGLEEVYGVLVITQKEGSPSRPYQLTEYETHFGKGYTTTRSRGNITIEALQGRFGETAVYRLDGGAPDQVRVLVKTTNRLLVPKDPAVLRAGFDDYTATLDYSARATNGRVEITGELLALPTPSIRLRAGDALVGDWRIEDTVKTSSANTPLRLEDLRKDGKSQWFTFRAVGPGSTDLFFGVSLVFAHVRVE